MTYNANCTFADEILEQIAERGLEFLPLVIGRDFPEGGREVEADGRHFAPFREVV